MPAPEYPLKAVLPPAPDPADVPYAVKGAVLRIVRNLGPTEVKPIELPAEGSITIDLGPVPHGEQVHCTLCHITDDGREIPVHVGSTHAGSPYVGNPDAPFRVVAVLPEDHPSLARQAKPLGQPAEPERKQTLLGQLGDSPDWKNLNREPGPAESGKVHRIPQS